ncbi:hypothetical protein K505DRAFT_366057 [Melanomma pulvis-pyrius CBS 109.77]|uniref:C2H2-type domain-containing protein n=1 Tax=Melanomma pulvis-pyrius CBS 109.77 TaxID=1314802 RepID=A0A6A6WYC0_9PLEO|nr:hypothetical protein K505DRAFT_366057 [Melanomma pulvis-pyrius CBS 109.77]
MDPSLSAAPMGSFYPDPDGMLDAICELCCLSIDYCAHSMSNQPLRAPTFTPDTFLKHPAWPQDAVPGLEVLSDYEMEEALPPTYFESRPPLLDDITREFNGNATIMQSSTIQVHVEGTYTVGDRLAQVGSRQLPRRQAPRPGGFLCPHEGCEKAFDRSCDLRRHQKTHMDRSERPHKCLVCKEGFLYPKDRNRHERTHDQSSSPQGMLYCPVAGCNNVDGFSRRDNLLRHKRTQHPHLIARS